MPEQPSPGHRRADAEGGHEVGGRDRLPLAGRSILVTRPAAQAAGFSDAIAAAGGRPLLLPLIEIEPQIDEATFDGLAQRLDDFDYVFFVSANAVEHGVAAIRARRAWPPGPAVATVGPGSAKALREAGFNEVLVPAERFDSEGMLELPEFSADQIAGRRVLILRGDAGRELFADALRERGADVEVAACYRRHFPPISVEALDAADALTLTSSEAVRHLAKLLRQQQFEALFARPVFTPHPRIAAAAREEGFAEVHETAGGDVGLMQGLLLHFGARI
jgi:uroporphyrinogen-III synthase